MIIIKLSSTQKCRNQARARYNSKKTVYFCMVLNSLLVFRKKNYATAVRQMAMFRQCRPPLSCKNIPFETHIAITTVSCDSSVCYLHDRWRCDSIVVETRSAVDMIENDRRRLLRINLRDRGRTRRANKADDTYPLRGIDESIF